MSDKPSAAEQAFEEWSKMEYVRTGFITSQEEARAIWRAAIESLSEQLERAEADAARSRGLRRGHEEGWALIHFLHDGPLTQVPSAIDKRVDVAIARKESHE